MPQFFFVVVVVVVVVVVCVCVVDLLVFCEGPMAFACLQSGKIFPRQSRRSVAVE